ncbi:MAG: hypothetical protein IJF75_03550 [Clostridia bacterium]|nr:hypothetical protein [Clostridia bacterium]
MLNKKERAVMNVIYNKCKSGTCCLISIDEIYKKLSKNRKMTKENIQKVVHLLELDDYFEVVNSERRGEPVLCINLHSKGLSFRREIVQLRRMIFIRLLLAGMSAVATFIVGRILFFFFT